MKRRNPLYWDLRSLPEEILKSRPFSRYRKDVDKPKRLKLGGVIGEVGSLPLKGAREKWLPSTQLFVLSPFALEPFGYQTYNVYDLQSNIQENRELRNTIRSLVGEPRADAIIYIPTINTLEGNPELFTPFMMLHDIGEIIFGRSIMSLGENPLSWIYWKAWEVWGKYRITYEENQMLRLKGIPLSIPAYIPKLVHVQPHLPLRKFGGQGYVQQAAAVYLNYLLPGYNTNFISDLWALWCKNERLTPANFWPIEDTMNFYSKHLATDINAVVSEYPLPVEDYCAELNEVFPIILDSIKGTILAGPG